MEFEMNYYLLSSHNAENPFWIEHPFQLSRAYVEAFEPLVELKFQRFENQCGTLLHTPLVF